MRPCVKIESREAFYCIHVDMDTAQWYGLAGTEANLGSGPTTIHKDKLFEPHCETEYC